MKFFGVIALIASASALHGEPERSGQTQQYDDYGPTEKVQNLMPRRYERSANSNYVDGVHVKRTTWYAQLDDDLVTPYTYNDQHSASNAEILNSFKSVDIKPVKSIDTAEFTKDLQSLQEQISAADAEVAREEKNKKFRPTWRNGDIVTSI